MRNESRKELPGWLVLLAALFFALLFWWIWLSFGVKLVHSQMVEHASGYATNAAKVAGTATSGGSVSASDRMAAIAEFGQSGDAFGGASALFAAIAGALVFWAGVLQSRSLKEAKVAAQLATQAYQEERATNRREQFISTFFQMLTLNRQLIERVDMLGNTNSISDDGHRQGAAALDSFAWSLVRRLEDGSIQCQEIKHQASFIATTYIGSVYDKRPSSLGPYFRLLYQTFKFVAEAELDEDEKIRFANIARGQISEGAVMLLAANGLTERGHQFIPLIERFGLLEHLHNDYRNSFKPALLEGYRQRAFMGSKEREKYPWSPTPLRSAHYFITWPDAIDTTTTSGSK
jgi:hypothetical protein